LREAVIAVDTSVKLRFERSNFVEETAMTKESMALMEHLRQQGEKDFLKEMVEEMLARMMDYEVSNQIRAERHERSGERQTYRNG
jgi:transposase-like protein